MTQHDIAHPPSVSRDNWLATRIEHLAHEPVEAVRSVQRDLEHRPQHRDRLPGMARWPV